MKKNEYVTKSGKKIYVFREVYNYDRQLNLLDWCVRQNYRLYCVSEHMYINASKVLVRPFENTIGGLAAKNAIQWTEADKGTLDEKTGVTTWQVSGKIYPSIINKGETSAYFSGAFTITLNAKSEQYVIGLGAKGANIVDGKTTTELTAFNMGITLSKGQTINSTKGYTPTLVSGTYT